MVAAGMTFLLIPIAFVAGCCLVVYQFPRRTQALDTRFLHMFAFLLFRYKPDVYWFAVVFILRNMLIALAPTLPGPVPQVIAVVVLLLASLTISTKFFPWRVEKANYIDIAVTVHMIIMMCVCAFFVTDSNPRAIGILCSILVSSNIVIVIVAISRAGAGHIRLRMCKPFKYFICHHKAGAGAFARLLKLQLQESLKVTTGIFIDCDNLVNLDMLFDYVANQTETLVVLMSKELILRPWCIGEVVTAHSKHPAVQTVPVIFPDYNAPTDIFIQNYGADVDIGILGVHGMTLDMVQATIMWLRNLAAITLPESRLLSNAMTKELGRLIISRNFAGSLDKGVLNKSSFGSQETLQTSQTKVAIVADHSNMESLATGLVLCKLVVQHTAHDTTMIPHLYPSGKDLPEIVTICVFILTNGVFSNAQFIASMIQAAKFQTSFVPIIAEDGFRFPSKAMLEELRFTLPSALITIGSTLRVDAVLELIQALFKEIGIVFAPQGFSSSTEGLLRIKAKDVAGRLLDKNLQKLLLQTGAEVQEEELAHSKPAEITDQEYPDVSV